MDENVVLEVLVDRALANEVSEKGIAEIVLRQANARFTSMVKCKVMNNSGKNNSDDIDSIIESLAARVSTSPQLRETRGLLQGLQKNGTVMSNTVKNMSLQVDRIYRQASVMQAVSFLNVGLNLANLATNIAGFVIVGKKLDLLSATVQDIAEGVSAISSKQNQEILRECNEIAMHYNTLTDSIRNGEELTNNQFEEWLRKTNTMISMLLGNLSSGALDIEMVSNIIYPILPAYTNVLREFITTYFYRYNSRPSNYESYLSIYDILARTDYIDKLQDYYMLEQKNSFIEVTDIINAHILLIVNGRTMIEDQMGLLEAFHTRSRMEAFNKRLDRYAAKQLKDAVPLAANELKMDEKMLKQYLV